ncbi:MAG TPA: cob(I)yrinic acid a,c-diamide adenosyltransferase, partial [Thermoleophilia bacterium]|nr:cob(I)yrinic acid a,c-diamide adenosyltransferase [Thermoleophilia bacterium]
LNYAVDYGFVDPAEVVAFLHEKPARLSVIITGRRARQEIMDEADTVTEMRSVKHPFRSGTRAQKGIEY